MDVMQTSTWFLFKRKSIFSVKIYINDDKVAIEFTKQ